jgi:proteasome assembly chaperone (PAC2) family protein
MEALHWQNRPSLNGPVMVAAFRGWTDAGGAASSAATYLADQWNARPFATVDAEDFYDFTSLRPQVRLTDDGVREIVWPENRFLATAVPGGSRDVVFLIGIEPHLRWGAFCECVTTVAKAVGARELVTLGSMLTDVVHTRTPPVRGWTSDPRLSDRFGLSRPQYEGPTGILGVMQHAFAEVDIPVASLMTQVPHYVPNTPSPKATLALVERVCTLLDTHIATAPLELASAAYEREVSEVVAADDDIAGYVRQLEERSDGDDAVSLADLPSREALAAELERFLREQDRPT